ncbi:MAG: PEP-CTERM sorting domain-containing protein [Terriglobia bacterium]
MRLKIAALIAGIAMMTSPAWATSANINFSACPSGQTCPGQIGVSQTYNAGGYTVTAYGFEKNSDGVFVAGNLYVKQSGGDESGLGLANEHDREIDTNQFIQLDFTNLANAGITSGSLMIGSVQSGEGYGIYTSNQVGTLGSLDLNGTLDKTYLPISWTANDPIVGVNAYVPTHGSSGSDVLLMNFSANPPSPTPEPASLALMGTGLMGLAFVYRKYAKTSLAKNQ